MSRISKAFRIGCLVVAGIFVLAVIAFILIFTVGYEYASWYTEEQHLERIAERVEKRYFSKDSEYDYTDYEVFPLYNENEELKYALVEFEPQGFVYIAINEKSIDWIPGLTGMYQRHLQEGQPWKRYKMVEKYSEAADKYFWEKEFEKDENGEEIEYYSSHFKVAGIENERRYLIDEDYGKTVAIKKEGKFICLMSLEEYNKEIPSYEWITFAYKAVKNL